jgi:ligand-binding sensor domain-containing protein
MAINQSGEIWLSDGKTMIGKFDKEKRSFIPYSIADISSLAFDQTDGLWLGSFQAGISEFDGQKQQPYHTGEDLISNFVLSSAIGTDGSIWFGTCCGVSEYDGKEWHSYTTGNGLIHNSVLSIAAAPDGSVWFGTEAGISSFNGNSWINYDAEDGLPDNRITDIAVGSDGSVWSISQSGISRYSEGEWQLVSLPEGFAKNNFPAIAAGKDGRVWVSTRDGFAFLDGNRWVMVKIGSIAPITSIVISEQGDLWLGTFSAGAIFLSNVFWEQIIAQMPSEPIENVRFNPDNSISIANNGEDFPVAGVSWQQFTATNGLADNSVSFMSMDRDGAVWVATKSGVSRILDFQVVPYAGEEFLGNRKVQTIVQDQSGNIWFGMILEGVISIRP